MYYEADNLKILHPSLECRSAAEAARSSVVTSYVQNLLLFLRPILLFAQLFEGDCIRERIIRKTIRY